MAARGYSDGMVGDLNTTALWVAAMFDCFVVELDSGKRAEPGVVEGAGERFRLAEEHMDGSRTELLVEACWDSGQSQPGKVDGLEVDPWYLEAGAGREQVG